MRTKRKIRLDLITCLAVLISGCGAGTQAPSSSSEEKTPPTFEELKNASYSGFEDPAEPIQLANGSWEGEPFVEGGAVQPRLLLLPDSQLNGDLDNDGAEEAVVLLNYNSGGTGQLLYIAVVSYREGKLQNTATGLVGDRVQLRDARIVDGAVVLDVVQAGASDAACCPGEVTTRAWRMGSGSSLEPVPNEEPVRRLTLSELQPSEWVLRKWGLEEDAPAEPSVTLRYEGGRFYGSNGCNNYSASVSEGDSPGDIVIGPGAATLMACPPPQMDVESRFMKQLAAVRKYGFFNRRLALTFEMDGRIDLMLLEPRPLPEPGD